MPDDRYTHFDIAPTAIRTQPIKVQGRAKAFLRPDYSAHGDFLRERAAEVQSYASTVADAEASESIFLEVRTPPSLPIRGERQRLKSAGFDILALSPIDPNSGTARIKKSDASRLRGKLHAYATSKDNRGKSYLSVIEDLAPVPVENKISEELVGVGDEPIDCLLLFYATLTERERAAVLLAVRSFLTRTTGSLGAMRRFSNGVMAAEARLRPSEARIAGAAFSTLRQVVPNHVFFVPDSWRISPLPADLTVAPPLLKSSVAIIDTGVAPSCRGLAGCVSQVLPFLPAAAVAPEYSHGTFVGSRVVYGDDLSQGLQRGALAPLCSIVDVPVFGVDAANKRIDIHEGHLAAAIDDVLPRLPRNTRVVNLSVGNTIPTVDGQISIVSQLLDKHVRELNLVAVTTAGNIRDPNLIAAFPASLTHEACRIDAPGDSILALTVGSIAHFAEGAAMSVPREMSAFSRRGPGPFGGLKPDLVAHGGNCFGDGITTPRIGVHGLSHERDSWAFDYGTSFAAPLVAAMSVRLVEHYQDPHANLVRALLLHFTRPVQTPQIAVPPEYLTGLGEPDVDAAMWSRDHAAAFLFSGTLTANAFTFIPFFVPPSLAPGLGHRLRIRATLVIDPPVTPDNHLEYSQARVTIGLRKPADVGHKEVSGVDETVEVDKWSPVVQVDKVFQRSYQTGQWEVRARLWTRDLPSDFRQTFAVVVEVIDEQGTAPVRVETESVAGPTFRHIQARVAA